MTIPDTLVNISTQLNDSSWQRDIDRLMKKLEGPPVSTNKTQTQIQIQETQIEDQRIEENIQQPTCPSPKVQRSQRNTTQPKTTTATIQTDSPEQHPCCQDVSNCPCVIVRIRIIFILSSVLFFCFENRNTAN